MGKLYDRLQKQLKSEEYKKDAEDCLKIYEKLKELNNGSVWDSDWRQLTTIGGWIGDKYPKTMVDKPSKLGYELLKGIEEKKEREAGVEISIDRLQIERRELSDKLVKLDAFMNSGKFATVVKSLNQRMLMREQSEIMTEYVEILDKRIEYLASKGVSFK